MDKEEQAGKIMAKQMKEFISEDMDEFKILKEMFSKEDIEVRTEMRGFEEIGAFAKYYWVSDMKFTKDTDLKALLNMQLKLRLSYLRKSRKEFLEGFKRGDLSQNKLNKGFMERIGLG